MERSVSSIYSLALSGVLSVTHIAASERVPSVLVDLIYHYCKPITPELNNTIPNPAPRNSHAVVDNNAITFLYDSKKPDTFKLEAVIKDITSKRYVVSAMYACQREARDWTFADPKIRMRTEILVAIDSRQYLESDAYFDLLKNQEKQMCAKDITIYTNPTTIKNVDFTTTFTAKQNNDGSIDITVRHDGLELRNAIYHACNGTFVNHASNGVTNSIMRPLRSPKKPAKEALPLKRFFPKLSQPK